MLREGMYLADRYEIVGKIGAGGMADVYKAKDHTLGRFVAIKVLKQEFSEDVNFVTKFCTEAQSAAGLEHPNIVNIYDVGSENGQYYIVMECIEGITLKTYIEKKGQLSFKEAVSIAIQVGRGIESAHNKHIIHRDIKPQNIIISTEGKVKVTDFGIARVASSNTINSDVMGSVHYASPEQARNGFVDGKSDVYSLGIVMYEMVTGRVPFDGESAVAVAIQHLQEEMVVPSSYAPNLPISMEKIILKCTQKSPDRRYESISDLLLDLKKGLISPNEDFVVMVPSGFGQQDKTRVIKPEEVESIKEQTNKIYYNEDEENDENDEEDDEDEEGGFLNPKMEKAVTIMGIVAAVIIVLIVAYIAISLMGGFKFKDKDKAKDDKNKQQEEIVDKVEMIDVKGMTFEEATDALNKINLGIKKGSTVSSDQYEAGQIVEQSEKDGSMVKKNTTITVTISSGVGEIDVPDVKTLDKDTAESTLRAAGFKVATDYAYNGDVPSGNVISQTPDGGTKAKKDDTVTITVSRGTELVKMISVLGMSQAEAENAIIGIGLNISSVSSDYSDTVPEGCVTEQSIAEGKFVDPGTGVTLKVSLGKRIETYSLNNYTIDKSGVGIPDDATGISANITLFKSEGEDSINSWSAKSFPFTVNQGNIENCSEGYFVIDWSWSVIDEEGNAKNEQKQTTIEGVGFTKN